MTTIERTRHSYRQRPKSFPFRSCIDVKKAKSLRIVKLPEKYNHIDFGRDFSSQLYPSSKWATENRKQYGGRQLEAPRTKPDFVITSLDTRKHNPQTTQIFHIRRINRKPVCSVQASFEDGPDIIPHHHASVYADSYQGRMREGTRIHRLEKKPAEGIIPVNEKLTDVRKEMMLPVCDSTVIPSAQNPHRYLLRKRKVPPPYRSSGIIYPALEKPRMTSYQPGMVQTGDLPFQNETRGEVPHAQGDRISVSSLSGLSFTRRKCIPPPQNHILSAHDSSRPCSPVCVTKLAGQKFTRRRRLSPPTCEMYSCFDGGVAETTSNKFDDKYLPFIRAKTII